MGMAVVNAWFCDCHAYNKMKKIPVPMKSGTTFNARVECKRCGKVQQGEVIVDYWAVKKNDLIGVDEGK